MEADARETPTSLTPAPSSEAREFFLREHEEMGKRLEFARDDVVRAETIAPVAAAGIVSWALAQEQITIASPVAVYLIPLVIAVVGFLRFLSRFLLVQTVEKYLRCLEETLSRKEEPGGYENFYKKETGRGLGVPLLLFSRLLMWIGLLAGTGDLFGDSLLQEGLSRTEKAFIAGGLCLVAAIFGILLERRRRRADSAHPARSEDRSGSVDPAAKAAGVAPDRS